MDIMQKASELRLNSLCEESPAEVILRLLLVGAREEFHESGFDSRLLYDVDDHGAILLGFQRG